MSINLSASHDQKNRGKNVNPQPGRVRVGRRRLTTGFTQLDNKILRHESLSFKARGILSYLLSHDESWVIRMADLVKGIDKESSVRAGFDELIAKGYARRSRVRNERGRLLGWEYEVWDQPDLEAAAVTETRFSSAGPTDTGKSSPKNTIYAKNTNCSKNRSVSLQDTDAQSAAGGSSDEDEAIARYNEAQEQDARTETGQETDLLLKSEDDEPGDKTFPWRQVYVAMKRITPELTLNQRGSRRDHRMKAFWRKRGKTIGSFEVLARKVQHSDFLMARNGHKGQNGKPYPWSWVFDVGQDGVLRADKIMEDFYANDRMAFVHEKAKKSRMVKVLLQTKTEPTLVDMEEMWNGEPRYKAYGERCGFPDVVDYKALCA